MLQTLEIRGYRGFESYRLTNLARVNLVVGKNNCGKTAVLEAIELLVSGGHPSVFLASLARRSGAGLREVSSDISPIFIGHKCVPGASFELSSDDAGNTLSVRILSLEEIGDEAEDWCLDGTQRQRRNLGHPFFAVGLLSVRRLSERPRLFDRADHTIFFDPLFGQQIEQRRPVEVRGPADEPCVERAGARHSGPCEAAQQGVEPSGIGRVGLLAAKPVVQGGTAHLQNP